MQSNENNEGENQKSVVMTKGSKYITSQKELSALRQEQKQLK